MTFRTAVVVLPDLPLPKETGVDLRVLTELAVLRSLGWHTIAVWFQTTRRRADPVELSAYADVVIAGGPRVEALSVSRRIMERIGALGHAFSRTPARTYPYASRYDAAEGRSRVIEAVRSHGATVVLLPTFLSHWAPEIKSEGVTIIGDSYDIQSLFALQLFRSYAPRSPLRAPGLAVNVIASRSQDHLFLPLCAEIWVTTLLEADVVRHLAPNANVLVLGNGLEEHDYPATVAPSSRVVGFIGNFTYQPNRDAAEELACRIWPRVLDQVPDARLRLAGDGMPFELQARLEQRGAEVLGRVADAAAFVQSCTALAMPIRARGGLPLKLIEGLAAGRPVVATPELVQGSGLIAGRDVLVAAESADIADALVRVLTTPELAGALSDAGRAVFLDSFSVRAMTRRAAASSVLTRLLASPLEPVVEADQSDCDHVDYE